MKLLISFTKNDFISICLISIKDELTSFAARPRVVSDPAVTHGTGHGVQTSTTVGAGVAGAGRHWRAAACRDGGDLPGLFLGIFAKRFRKILIHCIRIKTNITQNSSNMIQIYTQNIYQNNEPLVYW